MTKSLITVLLIGLFLSGVVALGFVIHSNWKGSNPEIVSIKADVPVVPEVIVDCLDPSLEDVGDKWKVEIARRWPRCAVLLCHGVAAVKGEWDLDTNPMDEIPLETVDTAIKNEQKLRPGMPVILLCCNPEHIELHGYGKDRVFYSLWDIWSQPDKTATKDIISKEYANDPFGVGNAFEFISAE